MKMKDLVPMNTEVTLRNGNKYVAGNFALYEHTYFGEEHVNSYRIVFPKDDCQYSITNNKNKYVGIILPDQSAFKLKYVLGAISFNDSLLDEDAKNSINKGELIVCDFNIDNFQQRIVTENELRQYIYFVSTFSGWNAWPNKRANVLTALRRKLEVRDLNHGKIELSNYEREDEAIRHKLDSALDVVHIQKYILPFTKITD